MTKAEKHFRETYGVKPTWPKSLENHIQVRNLEAFAKKAYLAASDKSEEVAEKEFSKWAQNGGE